MIANYAKTSELRQVAVLNKWSLRDRVSYSFTAYNLYFVLILDEFARSLRNVVQFVNNSYAV